MEGTQTKKNHAVANFGPWAKLDEHRWTHPRIEGLKARGKVFLKQPLGLTGIEASLNKFKPGWGFLCLGGKGEMLVDGEVIPLEQGTAVRVSPEGVRAIRNVSGDDFYYLCIQATAGSMPDDETVSDGQPDGGPVPWPSRD